MSKGKAGLFNQIHGVIQGADAGDYVQTRIGRDMNGPYLVVKYLNEDDQWESYNVEVERID